MTNTHAGFSDQLQSIRHLVQVSDSGSEAGMEETGSDGDIETQLQGPVVNVGSIGPEKATIKIEVNNPPPRHQGPPLHLVHDEEAVEFARGMKDEINRFKKNSETPPRAESRKDPEQDPEDIELERRLRQSEIERNKAIAKEAKASAILQTGVGVAVITLSVSALAMVWKSMRGGR